MKSLYNIFFSFVLLLATTQAFALPDVKVTLKVIDDEGQPVDGASASVNFKAGSEGNTDTERTDSDGLATLSGSSTRFIEYGAGKEGYYSTWYQKSYSKFTGMTGFRRWQPWNETLTLELRKIKNPRDLYIGNTSGSSSNGTPIKLPGTDKEYAYDLIARDWVVPHGLGTHRDFVFKLTGEITGHNEYDYTLSLRFSNDGDGIQQYDADPMWGSRLRLPHEAPVNGYQSELIQRSARTFDRFIANDFPDDRNYFFRIRTEKDANGNIVSALYGKIYGNIRFSIGDKRTVTMLYYLNPDSNDRNLEADYKKNLFPSTQKYGFPAYPP
ncbi:MAG TPA: Ig-like domain-containing protein [Gammaproteobacteria bacterium]